MENLYRNYPRKKNNFMKYRKYWLLLAVVLFAFAGCKDDDTNPDIRSSEWNFEVVFNINDPRLYTFNAIGTATLQTDSVSYAITANYTIGGTEFDDVEISGDIQDGALDLTDKTFDVLYQDGVVSYTETIVLNLPDINTDSTSANGTGTVVIIRSDTGASESGTIDFTATKL